MIFDVGSQSPWLSPPKSSPSKPTAKPFGVRKPLATACQVRASGSIFSSEPGPFGTGNADRDPGKYAVLPLRNGTDVVNQRKPSLRTRTKVTSC